MGFGIVKYDRIREYAVLCEGIARAITPSTSIFLHY